MEHLEPVLQLGAEATANLKVTYRISDHLLHRPGKGFLSLLLMYFIEVMYTCVLRKWVFSSSWNNPHESDLLATWHWNKLTASSFLLCSCISKISFNRCYPVWRGPLNDIIELLVSFLTFPVKFARLVAISSCEWLTFLLILLAIRLSSLEMTWNSHVKVTEFFSFSRVLL